MPEENQNGNGGQEAQQPQQPQQQENAEEKRQKFLIDYEAAKRKVASRNLENIAKGADEAKNIKAYDLMQRAGNEYEIAADNVKDNVAKQKELLGKAAELYKELAGVGEYAPGIRVAYRLFELGELEQARDLAEQVEAVDLLGRIGEAAEAAGRNDPKMYDVAAKAYIANGYDEALGDVMENWSPANGWGNYVVEQQKRIKQIFDDRKKAARGN